MSQYVVISYFRESDENIATFSDVYKTVEEAIQNKIDSIQRYESDIDTEYNEMEIARVKQDYDSCNRIEIITGINAEKPIYVTMNGNYFMFKHPYITNNIDEWKKIMKTDKNPEDYQVIQL